LLDQYPDSGVGWQYLGLALKGQGLDAVPALEHAARLMPADAGAFVNYANALGAAGRFEEALAVYERALLLNPHSAEAHHNRGNALLDLGCIGAAEASYRRALELQPAYREARANLGQTLRAQGRLEEAVTQLEQAVSLSPRSAELHTTLGIALRDLGRLDAAIASHRRAIELRPELAVGHHQLAVALRLRGRTAEAAASCRRALELEPASAASRVVLAETCADRGRFAEAEEMLRHAIAADPESIEAWSGIARLRRLTIADAPWAAEVERLADKPRPPRQEVPLRYALGKYFDDIGEHARAFGQFRRANELTRRYRTPHDRKRLSRTMDAVIRRFDARWLDEARRSRAGTAAADEPAAQRPVFIVGMLRSGTSLAEQILASHPAVFGAGELDFWSARAVAWAANAPGAQDIGTLAGEYLRLLAQLSADATRVIDKMPANFQHLGLIHAALPRARIIHLQRDPIDTCLSIYFQHFESMHGYATDLEDLAHAYQDYLRLMRHWRALLPPSQLLEMRYEELVEDPEGASRRMLEFLGLPWDARCLEFERTERTVITASKWQVRQKLSRTSIGRWRHYEPFIAPLRERLLALEASAAARG